MQKQRRFSEYKWLLLLPATVGLYFAFGFLLELLDQQMLGPQPTVIQDAIRDARTAPAILRRTGPISASKYVLRKDHYTPDSLQVQIRLTGERADAQISVYAVQQAEGGWRIYRSDTTYTAPE